MPRKLRLSNKKGRKADGRRNAGRSTQREQDGNTTTHSEQSTQVSTVVESTQSSVAVFVEPPSKKQRIDKGMTVSAKAEPTVGLSCGTAVVPPQARTWEPAAGPSHAPSQNAYVFETHESTPRKFFLFGFYYYFFKLMYF